MGRFKRTRKEIHIEIKYNDLDIAAREYIKLFNIPFEEDNTKDIVLPIASDIKLLLDGYHNDSQL